MNLEDYIDLEKINLDEFFQFWKESHEEDPENFPMEMEEGDWWEQFIIYNQTN